MEGVSSFFRQVVVSRGEERVERSTPSSCQEFTLLANRFLSSHAFLIAKILGGSARLDAGSRTRLTRLARRVTVWGV